MQIQNTLNYLTFRQIFSNL